MAIGLIPPPSLFRKHGAFRTNNSSFPSEHLDRTSIGSVSANKRRRSPKRNPWPECVQSLIVPNLLIERAIIKSRPFGGRGMQRRIRIAKSPEHACVYGAVARNAARSYLVEEEYVSCVR